MIIGAGLGLGASYELRAVRPNQANIGHIYSSKPAKGVPDAHDAGRARPEFLQDQQPVLCFDAMGALPNSTAAVQLALLPVGSIPLCGSPQWLPSAEYLKHMITLDKCNIKPLLCSA